MPALSVGGFCFSSFFVGCSRLCGVPSFRPWPPQAIPDTFDMTAVCLVSIYGPLKTVRRAATVPFACGRRLASSDTFRYRVGV